MAVQPKDSLLCYLGFVQWGDIGGITTYRRPDGRVVAFAKTYPGKPPSIDQLAQRARFLAGAHAWNALSPAQRTQWNLAATRASLCMHGRDLHASAYLRPDPSAIATIARQTATTLTV